MRRWWPRFRHLFGCWPDPMYLHFDGASFTSRCAHCGRRILKDSQGGWF